MAKDKTDAPRITSSSDLKDDLKSAGFWLTCWIALVAFTRMLANTFIAGNDVAELGQDLCAYGTEAIRTEFPKLNEVE